MLMRCRGIGVVALRARIERNFAELAERVQLIERVVDGGAAELGQARGGALEDFLGGEVDVRTLEGFGDHAPLGSHTQAAMAQTLPQGNGTERFDFVDSFHQINGAELALP